MLLRLSLNPRCAPPMPKPKSSCCGKPKKKRCKRCPKRF